MDDPQRDRGGMRGVRGNCGEPRGQSNVIANMTSEDEIDISLPFVWSTRDRSTSHLEQFVNVFGIPGTPTCYAGGGAFGTHVE